MLGFLFPSLVGVGDVGVLPSPSSSFFISVVPEMIQVALTSWRWFNGPCFSHMAPF